MYTSSTFELEGLIDSFTEETDCYPSVCGYLRFHLRNALETIEEKHPETFNEVMDYIKERTRARTKELIEQKGDKNEQSK